MSAAPSVFAGLFLRVSDPEMTRDALEDFTTEAVAGAIRRDSEPMVRALARAGALNTSMVSGQPLTVFTQRAHLVDGDSIRLDLVLSWPLVPLELWIEVKTGAPLSGWLDRTRDGVTVRRSQLGRYLDAATVMSATDGIQRPPVVLLADEDVRFSGGRAAATGVGGIVPVFVSWQDLADAVREQSAPDSLWLELVTFLKEKRMTQDAAFPITAREATSLADAHQLYRKSLDLLTEVNRRGAVALPELDWWGTGLPEMVRRQFRDHARFTLGLWNNSKVGLLFGLRLSASGEAMFMVWMETDPRNAAIRPEAHTLAETAGLRELGWEMPYDGWWFVEARAHTVNYPSLDAAAQWFVDRFVELRDAGLIALLKRYAPTAVIASEQSPGEDAE